MAKKGKSAPASLKALPVPEDKKGNAKNSKKDASSKASKDGDDDPKKPARGIVVGDNFGWTGKLPATLLYEHCQKQKWQKVEFDMMKKPNGFIGIVHLKWENPKTREVIQVKMIPESDLYTPQETTNSARHYAATYVLHRINFMKNMKIMLPRLFRDYWEDIEKKRLEILKSNKEKHDYIYNANPFLVVLNQREKQAKLEKEKQIKEQNELKIKKPTNIIVTTTKALEKSTASSNSKSNLKSKANSAAIVKQKTSKIPSFPKKVWENAPFIDFPSDLRLSIEKSLKKHIKWLDNVGPKSESLDKSTFELLKSLGFRELHIKESFQYTNATSFVDPLEWLIFHIPEDDLPPFFAKSDKDSLARFKIAKDLQFEYMMQRLQSSGFDIDDIVSMLKEYKNDELMTAVALTQSLINQTPASGEIGVSEESLELWNQELEGIETIGEHKISYLSNFSNKRVIEIELHPENIKHDLLKVRIYLAPNYPYEVPAIQLIVNDPSFNLANYIKLSILRQVLHYLVDNHIIGDLMVFTIVEWLETNIHRVIDNPGTLVDIHDKVTEGSNSTESRMNTTTTTNISSNTNKSKKTTTLLNHDLALMKEKYASRQTSPKLKEMINQRTNLPAWKKRVQLVDVINSNRVTLITGETGSGKSTQIVQFILDHMSSQGNFSSTIICTQPRRISTIGLAERISEERIDKVGEETGYIIRGENKTSKHTRLSFVTTGVLLRILQSFLGSENAATSSSSIFNNLEYVFIDEVHERSVDSDFLLIILKRILKQFPKLKIIMMSATINTEVFMSFFETKVNHLHIEGRTFPIQDVYLDTILQDLDYSMTTFDGDIIKPKPDSHFFKSGNINYELYAQLAHHIDKKLSAEGDHNGSILIFMPGIMEINQCIKAIERAFDKLSSLSNCWCLPLHSALSSSDQKRVFSSPRNGSRKIVVSTNVAETSITIPDCVVVIDSGRVKTMYFNTDINATKLVEEWCSRAEVGQRRGRSGRITNGTCYHMYTKDTQDDVMKAQPTPEIKRIRLENLYLMVKSMGINKVEDFLNSGIDPPEQKSLTESKDFLIQIGALTEFDNSLTHLGKYLSFLPTDLQCAKLLIYGCLFGCLDICLSLASISSTGNPFINNMENRDKIKSILKKYSDRQGDSIAMANLFAAYAELQKDDKPRANKFITQNCLSYLTMKDIASNKSQYVAILKDINFIPQDYNELNTQHHLWLNKNNKNYPIIRAVLTGAMYPHLARVQMPQPKFVQSAVGALEVVPDTKDTKIWICNKDFVRKLKNNDDMQDTLPGTRAFLHPSSTMFIDSSKTLMSDLPNYEEYLKEDGTVDTEKAKELYKYQPKIDNGADGLKTSFIVFGNSHMSTKLYLREVTPISTLGALLFGGEIAYDLSSSIMNGKSSPGIVLDSWIPIRTWCKNGVLIKRLRLLVDELIETMLTKPGSRLDDSNADILSVIEQMVTST